jgi:hypothetical protein
MWLKLNHSKVLFCFSSHVLVHNGFCDIWKVTGEQWSVLGYQLCQCGVDVLHIRDSLCIHMQRLVWCAFSFLSRVFIYRVVTYPTREPLIYCSPTLHRHSWSPKNAPLQTAIMKASNSIWLGHNVNSVFCIWFWDSDWARIHAQSWIMSAQNTVHLPKSGCYSMDSTVMQCCKKTHMAWKFGFAMHK